MAVELYHNALSTCSQKVRLALAEKGTAWESRHIDLTRNEQKAPAYLALNPNGVVPTLVHDGRVVIESAVICEYVDDAFEGPPLRPATAYDRAQMRLWTKRVEERLHAANGALTIATVRRAMMLQRPREEVLAEIDATAEPSQREGRRALFALGVESAEAANALRALRRVLEAAEADLRARMWLAAETISLADMAVAPYVSRLDLLGLDWLWGETHFPAVGAWLERLRARPSYGTAIADHLPQGAPELFRRLAAPAMDRIRAAFA